MGVPSAACSRADEVGTGTTILAVSYKGGVVLAADTRTSAGAYVVNRASRKISKVHDKIYVCRSGSAADTQALTQFVKYYLNIHSLELGELPSVNTAATLFQSFHYDYKDMLMSGLIVAGWDGKRGGQIYSLPIGGSKIKVNVTAGGSGSVYISGLIDALYKEDMTKEEAQQLALKLLSHAMARDASSGGMVRMTTISEDGVEETTFEGDKLPTPA